MFTGLSQEGRKAIAVVPELPNREQPGSECKRLWLLKNSVQRILTKKFVRELLNFRSP